MDVETIDQNYEQLQDQGRQTVAALSALAQKLQRAVEAGDADAREWLLDLKEVALEVRAEQTQVAGLLQSLHGFVANQLQSPPPQPQYQPQPQPQYQQPYNQAPYGQQGYGQQGYGGQQQPAPQQGVGGMLSQFMGSGFGKAVTMGAGFAIGDDLIKDLFG